MTLKEITFENIVGKEEIVDVYNVFNSDKWSAILRVVCSEKYCNIVEIKTLSEKEKVSIFGKKFIPKTNGSSLGIDMVFLKTAIYTA